MKDVRPVSISVRDIVVLAALAALIAGASLFVQRSPIASSETRFVETSASGLQIVPASCPSEPPHFSGDTGTPDCDPEATNGCTITASPQSIQAGGSSTLTWSFDLDSGGANLPGFEATLTGFGSVPQSGTRSTGPLQETTTYTLSGQYRFGPFLSPTLFSCQRTVIVDAGQCVPNYTCVNNGVRNSCTGAVTPCGAGLVCQNAQCVCPVGGAPPVNGQCDSQCPVGQHPLDWTSATSACVCNTNNQPPVNGQCPIAQCTEQFYCSGDDLWIRNRNNQCSDGVLEQTCSYGCSNGACTIPTSTGNIVAEPRLVRSGETTTVSWETEFMEEDSCTVSENNPEINDSGSGPSGTFVTSAIRMQTRYTLNCTRANGQAFSDFDIVNVIPIFEEQ